MTKQWTGRRVVVTRPADRASGLMRRLRESGAEAILYPTIATVSPSSWRAVDAALHALSSYDWAVFTSPAGVRTTCARAVELSIVPAMWTAVRIAAVGPATAGALHEFDLHASARPARAIGNAIADACLAAGGGSAPAAAPHAPRFLLLRGNLARTGLPDALRARGAIVHDVETYRTVILTGTDTTAADLIRTSDAITFSSPSTVRGFLNALGSAGWTGAAAVVTIGPTTSAAARDAGLDVHAQAEEPTDDGMIEALERAFEGQKTGVPYDDG
ncbi:MAG: uroporphyrinogen-III synthase [Longimicrobiales bacterium]